MRLKTVLLALAATVVLTTPAMARVKEYYTLDAGGCLPGDTVNKQPCCSGFHCSSGFRLNPNDPRIIARAVVGPTGKIGPVLKGPKTGRLAPATPATQPQPGAPTVPGAN
jgi:hypothetical protein